MKSFSFLTLFILVSFNLISQDETKDTVLITSENVYFDFGKDEIRSSEMSRLNQLAEKVQGDIQGFIRLTGHTDSIGTNNNNDELSQRRANNVIQYLVGKRIAPLPFYTVYGGENIPVADNGSDEGRQLNRRVEISVFQVNSKVAPLVEVREEIVLAPAPKTPRTKVEFLVKDEETNKLIQTIINYKLFITDDVKTYDTNPKGQGSISLNLEKDTKIVFDFYAEGYFHNSDEVLIKVGEETLVSITLKPIKKGNKLALKNLYFYGNQSKLLPESIPELKRLKNSLAMNPNAVIEIGGHINYPNTHPDDVPLWSVNLSKERARVIYKYLVDSGIDAERLRHKGYSNTQMVNPTARQEVDMAPNRRVEIKVLEYTN